MDAKRRNVSKHSWKSSEESPTWLWQASGRDFAVTFWNQDYSVVKDAWHERESKDGDTTGSRAIVTEATAERSETGWRKMARGGTVVVDYDGMRVKCYDARRNLRMQTRREFLSIWAVLRGKFSIFYLSFGRPSLLTVQHERPGLMISLGRRSHW